MNFLRRNNADILLLGVAAVWGSSYLATKVLTVHGTVFAILAARFLIASVIMVIVWGIRREKFLDRRGLLIAVIFGFTQAAILSLETWGVALTSATNAGLIISMTIVFTPILESVWMKKWLPRSYFVAATVAVVGVLLLVSANGLRELNWGDALMLAAALVRSLHVTALGRLTTGFQYGSVSITLVQTVVCAVLFVVLDLPGLGTSFQNFTPMDWLDLFYLAAACTVFAFLVQLWAVRKTSAARVSLLLGTEPIWAVLIGVSLGSETLGWLGIAGAILIIVASYRAQTIELKHRIVPVLSSGPA
ncbi:drug/metabolite transporter (DMT)-like permease [Aurantimicrobium minutum]|uniref:DMT family transporter n=1 Tax=Aurantimicrobium minutum TaxID=708131 RepID=UPI002473DAA4|nr:DMT family transporter [Aurantimicrobium minutum]MDH6532831.1 drug/metabolite transporter (DMT)-like permease [Aurantimicrobium minutum]